MPFTFAHPAVILPFSRNSKYIHFLAMVLGSMSPDFEYFLHGKPYQDIGHTWIGFITLNIFLVVVVYLIYHTCIQATLFSHLSSCLNNTYSKKPDANKLLKATVFLYSALFGMITHVVWDSFTHLNGFMVRHIPVLTYNFNIYSFRIPLFKLLQHGSTLIGILVIIGYMYYRTKKYGSNDKDSPNLNQKWMYWGLISVCTIILFSLWYLIIPVSTEAYGIIVVRIIDAALIGLLVISLIFKGFNQANNE